MDILTVMVMAAALATVLVLVRGIGSMAQGGDYDAKHANELMFWRVGLQAVTVLLVLFALLMQMK